jgi:hypothetical protein
MQSPAAHAGTGIGVVRPVDCVRHPVLRAVVGGGVAEARCRTPLIVPVNDMVVPSIFGLLSYCTGTEVLNGVRCH